jgi:hypothetical protein
VLLNEGAGRGEDEDLGVLSAEYFGRDQCGDHRLPQSRGKDHEQVLLEPDPGSLDLERQGTDHPRSQERMLDQPVEHSPYSRDWFRVRPGERSEGGGRCLSRGRKIIEPALRAHGTSIG